MLLLCPLPVVLCCASVLPANEESRPSLDITVKVFPKKIQYGDALFTFVEIKNNTGETLIMPQRLVHPYRSAPFLDITSQLLREEEVIYEWNLKTLDWIEGVDISEPPPYELPENYPRQNCNAGGSRLIGASILWCPHYEFSSYPFVRVNFERFVGVASHSRTLSNFRVDTFKKIIIANQNDFALSSEISVPYLDLLNPDKKIRISQSTPYSDGMIDILQPKNVSLKIYAQSPETRELLARWFLELPSTWRPTGWMVDGIFVSPSYASGSPYNVDASTAQEMSKKRQLTHEDYIVFFSKMESRTSPIASFFW